MKRILTKLRLYDTLDLELKMSRNDLSDCLRKVSNSEQVTIFNLSPLRQVDFNWTIGELNQRNRLPIHFEIFQRHYIIFIIGLILSTLTISIFCITISIMMFVEKDNVTGFGILALYLLLLFVFTIRPIKRIQWSIIDLRYEIEKELRKREKQLTHI